MQEWAARFEYGHWAQKESATAGNSWMRVEASGGGYSPWEAIADATGFKLSKIRDFHLRLNPIPFAEADAILAAMGRTEEWFGRLNRWYPKATLRKRRVDAKLSDDAIRVLHRFYVGGMSMEELARTVWDRYGFRSSRACAIAISMGFHALGLKVLSHAESNTRHKTTHGMYAQLGERGYERWRRRQQGFSRPCATDSCRAYAMRESDKCNVHSGRGRVDHLDEGRMENVHLAIEARRRNLAKKRAA